MSETKSVNLKLLRVRLSFPALFKAKAFSDDQEPKFSAALIMDKVKNAADIKNVNAAVDAIIKDAFKGNKKGVKVCLRDGSEKEDTDGYGKDIMFLNASNQRKIPVVDKDVTPLDEESGKPYAGCYVNASIRLWAQDNKWGKRVNAQLRAVQFVADGEAFGDKATDPNEVFEAVEGEEGESSGGDASLL